LRTASYLQESVIVVIPFHLIRSNGSINTKTKKFSSGISLNSTLGVVKHNATVTVNIKSLLLGFVGDHFDKVGTSLDFLAVSNNSTNFRKIKRSI
jgi:hypothetical protein